MTEQPVEGGRLYVEVVSDASGFRRELQTKLNAAVSGLRARVQAEVAGQVEFDRAQIRRELATKLAQAARNVKVRVSVEADLTRAREEMTRFRREQERQPVRPPVRPEVDEPHLKKIAARLAKFGDSLTSSMRMPLLASGITAAAGAAVNLAGGLVAVTGAASQAVGVGAALPGVYATAAQAMGAFKLGVSGVGDAVKELEKEASKKAGLTPLQQAMSELSPAGRRLAKTIVSDVLPRFEDLRKAVQQAIAPGLRRAIRTAMPLLGTLQEGLVDTGRRAGYLTQQFAKLVASPGFRRDFAGVMASNNRSFTLVGQAAVHFADALRHVMVVAAPMVERLAEMTLRLAQLTSESAKAGRESGRMADFFDRAWRTASKLGSILVDLSVGLFNVFSLSRPTGDSLLDSLADAAERFRAATEDPANQERIRKFFEDTAPLTRQFGDLLVRVTELLLRLGEATGGNTFDGLFTVLNAAITLLEKLVSLPGGGQVLGTLLLLAGAGTGLGLVAKALAGIVGGLGTLAKFTGLAALFGGGDGDGGAGPLERIRNAWGRIQEGMARVRDTARQVRDGFVAAKNAAVQAAQAAGRQIRAGVQATGRGIRRGAQATGRGAQRATQAVGRGVQAAGRGIVAGVRSAGRVLVVAGRATGAAIVTGARAAGRALVTAGRAAGRGAAAAGRGARAAAVTVGRGAATAARATATALATAGRAALVASRNAALFAANMLRAGAAAAAAAARTVALAAAQMAVRAATAAWAAIQWVLNAAMSANPIGLIVVAIAALVAGVVLAYKRIGWFRDGVNAVFGFLKTAVVATINFVRDHWRLILTVLGGPLGLAIALVTKYWRQIYNAVKAAVGWVVDFVRQRWRLLITIVGGPLGAIVALVTKHWNKIKSTISAALSYIVGKVKSQLSAITSAISRGWQAVTSKTTSLASGLRSKITSLMTSLRMSFTNGVSAMGRAWDRLREATKRPINAFIGFYNRGVVDMWNKVMGWLRIGGMRLGRVGLLARGGTLANPLKAVPMVTNRPTAIVGEGRPAHPEFVIPTDPRYRDRARALWTAAGSKLQMLQRGGILGGVLGGIKKAAGKVMEIGQAGLDLIANPGKIWDRLAGPLLSQARGIGTSPYGKVIAAIPAKLLDVAKGAALQVIKAFEAGFGGGGAQSVVKAARTQIGVPYVWGGTAWNRGLDCSGLTMMSWLKGAKKNITRTTYTQRAHMRTIPGPRPGAVGQPHSGHTYLASRVQGGRTWVVEAMRTGTRISEHLLTRNTPWWGWPPGMESGGALIRRLGEQFIRGGRGSMLAKFLGVAGDPGGVVRGYKGDPGLRRDRGGPLPPGSWAYNGLSRTEWVLTPEAVDLLGGDRAVAAINASAPRLRQSRPASTAARPLAPAAGRGAGGAPVIHVHPQPGQSETEIAMITSRKLGAMLR